MVPALKSEFRKLLTVRSTYLISLLIVVLSCLFTYFGTSTEYVSTAPPSSQTQSTNRSAVQQAPPQKTKNLSKDKLAHNIIDTTGAAIFIAVVAVLIMGHEFRYNTITYTLTSSSNRSKVLLAKIIVATAYTVAASLLAVIATVAVTYVAVHVKGLNLPPQDIDWIYVNARLIGYILGFALIGLAIVTLLRNLTASIAALFILPTVDGLLGVLLTNNNIEPSKYLPFSALSRLTSDGRSGMTPFSLPSIPRAALVFIVYLVGLWAISWYFFLRRDAS